MKKLNNKGFSLVELIVVIAIMAVLVGVLAPQFIKYVEKSRESTDITNLDSIKQVVESYFADKEGDDLPAKIKIVPKAKSGVSGKFYTLEMKTKTNTDFTKISSDTVLEQGGVKDCKIKGSQWDSGKEPYAEWDLSANKWKYEAESKYYTTKSDQIVPE